MFHLWDLAPLAVTSAVFLILLAVNPAYEGGLIQASTDAGRLGPMLLATAVLLSLLAGAVQALFRNAWDATAILASRFSRFLLVVIWLALVSSALSVVLLGPAAIQLWIVCRQGA